ncbi:MAG: 2-hydroxyglutaryl-CoA dehydratase [Deltaproteobacteria bacterium]|nr:MAG: 2-hydroxyglutaryl-CoA dehydratase [Deltaproteobacteria bacterium]
MSEYFAGIDIGSTMTKVVIMNKGIISSIIGPTGPEQRRLANKVMERALKEVDLPFKAITYIVATGYGRINVPFADKQITEISCHAKGVASFFPEAKTVIDIGGQDCKGIRINSGKPIDFVMNDKCAAGTGRFLEIIADALGINIEKMGEIGLEGKKPAKISNICTVFAEQEVVSRLAEGVPLNDLVAGILESLANRISRMVNRLQVAEEVVVTGGGAKNVGLVKALSDKLGYNIVVPPEPLLTGAVGAALLGKDIAHKALKNGLSLERKERSLKEIEIL